jgi:hypothetical protein
MDEKDQSVRPLGRSRGGALVWVEFQECDVPVLVSAKSFVLPR